jgi:pyruvate/2-oxoglutarate dehydrogenase complex dihydrolipoamide acyltransferase (E2) component
MGDLNFDVVSRKKADQEIGSTSRGRKSEYEPVAEKWVEIDEDESIVLDGLANNDVQNIRNLMYRRFGKENVIVRSAKKADGTYKAIVRQREGGEYLRNGDDDSEPQDEGNPFSDVADDDADATDAAIELALSHGIDLSNVEGTGEGGRILKSDVQDQL